MKLALVLCVMIGSVNCGPQDDPFLTNLAKIDHYRWSGDRYLDSKGNPRAEVYKQSANWAFDVYWGSNINTDCCDDSERGAMVRAAILTVELDHENDLDAAHALVNHAFDETYRRLP